MSTFCLAVPHKGFGASLDFFEGPSKTCRQLLLGEYRLFNRENQKAVMSLRQEFMRSGDEGWHIDGGDDPGLPYSQFFRKALENKTLEKWAEIRRAQGRSVHVADFFGSAVFSNEPDKFDSLTGVRLHPIDPRRLPRAYRLRPKAWQEVTGEMFATDTWKKLDLATQARRIERFDAAIVRPVGPLTRWAETITIGDLQAQGLDRAFFKITQVFLERIWERLSSDEGLLLVELRESLLVHPLFIHWTENLLKKGIQIKIYDEDMGINHRFSYMRLIKTDPQSTLTTP